MGDDNDGTERLREAIAAGLKASAEAGLLEQSTRSALEAQLSALDERLGGEKTASHFAIEKRPDCCVVAVGGSAPVATEIVAAFMEAAGARRLGSSRAWLLPLGGLSTTRWARALRRAVSAERRSRKDSSSELPLTVTFIWPRDDDLVVASVS